MCASQAPSIADSTCSAVAPFPDSTVAPEYMSASTGTSAPSVVSPGPLARVTRRLPGGLAARARIQACADGATLKTRLPSAGSSAHGIGVQLARRNDHDGGITELPGRRAEDRVLQLRPDRVQDGPCAVRVGPGPPAGQPAQRERREVGGADRVLGAAGRELPHPPSPADEHVQRAVDVDDLDKLCPAELIEQRADVDHGTASPGHARRLQRAGPHHALEPKLLPLQRPRRRALPPGLLQPTGHLAQCGQPGVEFRVGGWPHRRHGQRGGPPALGPRQAAAAGGGRARRAAGRARPVPRPARWPGRATPTRRG